MSLFVTGTDTEIGKTVVAALVAARYGATYWKPVASGAATDPRDVETVARLAGVPVLDEVYLLERPASPHLAARLDGVSIDPHVLRAALSERCGRHPRLVVEGVGGLLVPLTHDPEPSADDESGVGAGYTVADLLVDSALPCLVVARAGLGTINHTLLTLEALRARGVDIAGIVISAGPGDAAADADRRAIEADNRQVIERLGGVPVVDVVEPLERLEPATVRSRARRFDPEGLLAPCFAP